MTNPETLKPGDRVVLIAMDDPYGPIPAGTRGDVKRVSQSIYGPRDHTIEVQWENGRTLNCICPPDAVEVI